MPNQNVRQLLVSMVTADAIRKAGRGRYVRPERVDLTDSDVPIYLGKNGKKVRNGENRNENNGDDDAEI